jgi:hypothetical protein
MVLLAFSLSRILQDTISASKEITEWKPLDIYKSFFVFHHVCKAYRTVNERMRNKGNEIVEEKLSSGFSVYIKKLEGKVIQDNSDTEDFVDKMIPLLLMNEVTF